MNDLRSEIRAAFEEEQAKHPPVADLRETVIRVAGSQPSRQASVQWIAVAAALVIATLVVAGLLSTRLTARQVPSHPQPSTTIVPKVPTFTGPPPAGVPVLYVGDPANPAWYFAIDWNGDARGVIHLSQPINQDQDLLQAPDGSGFVVTTFKGLSGAYLDRLGQPAGSHTPGGRILWAGDSRALCQLDSVSPQWRIMVTSAVGTVTADHAVAIDSPNLDSGAIAIRVAACSPATDRAVLVTNTYGRPAEVWVVRLSDGSILRHQSYPANQLSDIVSSPDGSLLAYDSNASTGYLLGGTAAATVIRRATDDSLLTTLDPSMGVIAFSADGTRALVATTPWASGAPTHLALVDVQTGAVLWRYDGGEELAGYWIEPGGGRVAVMLQAPPDQSLHASIDVVIVGADGSAKPIPGRYVRP